MKSKNERPTAIDFEKCTCTLLIELLGNMSIEGNEIK